MRLQGQHQTQARFDFNMSYVFFSDFMHDFYTVLFLFTSGGGDVKIESHKLNIKAKSKIGSMDNVGPGNGQTNGHKVKLHTVILLILLLVLSLRS